METIEQYLHNLYRIQPDFMYSVSRDFARACQTPLLVMPDDTPAHSLEAAMAMIDLAPKAQATPYPGRRILTSRPRPSNRCASSSRHTSRRRSASRISWTFRTDHSERSDSCAT